MVDHRDIELLKLRNFTISKKVDDKVFTEDDAQEQICEIIAAMHPFVSCFLPATWRFDDEQADTRCRLPS